jgi:hypothetical protein
MGAPMAPRPRKATVGMRGGKLGYGRVQGQGPRAKGRVEGGQWIDYP